LGITAAKFRDFLVKMRDPDFVLRGYEQVYRGYGQVYKQETEGEEFDIHRIVIEHARRFTHEPYVLACLADSFLTYWNYR
jgi:hypothetical protein